MTLVEAGIGLPFLLLCNVARAEAVRQEVDSREEDLTHICVVNVSEAKHEHEDGDVPVSVIRAKG